MNLTPQLFAMPMAVSFGGGGCVYTQQYVQEELWFDGFRATTYLKALSAPLPIVLGYPCLLRHWPVVNWVTREVTFTRRDRQYVIQGSREPTSEVLNYVATVPIHPLSDSESSDGTTSSTTSRGVLRREVPPLPEQV